MKKQKQNSNKTFNHNKESFLKKYKCQLLFVVILLLITCILAYLNFYLPINT